MKHLKVWRKCLTGHFPLYFGTIPGDTPATPPERREAAGAPLELFLSGWTDAVGKADVSDRYREVVGETVARVRGALTHHTTPNNLICTVLQSRLSPWGSNG